MHHLLTFLSTSSNALHTLHVLSHLHREFWSTPMVGGTVTTLDSLDTEDLREQLQIAEIKANLAADSPVSGESRMLVRKSHDPENPGLWLYKSLREASLDFGAFSVLVKGVQDTKEAEQNIIFATNKSDVLAYDNQWKFLKSGSTLVSVEFNDMSTSACTLL